MRYQYLLVTLGVLFTLLPSQPAIAHSVLEKVVNTGVLTVGTSKDAFPFAYKDKNGRLTGYSIDMSILIQKQVEKELKRPIKLDLIPLDPADRIPKLRSGAVDIVCDAASFTWERERDKEGIACMVPENNSTFLDVANYALSRFMQGFLKGKQPYVQT